jgi:Uma2 family endonuclease
MSTMLTVPPRLASSTPLENGEHLDAAEFLRRYQAMPELKKAELIQGRVFTGSPVRADQHGEPDHLIQTWTGVYVISTPGVIGATNTTVLLGRKDIPQPDVLLRILPEYGGQCLRNEDGYLVGPPDLAIEVAASSTSMDAHEKRDSYMEAGVREYLLWRTLDGAVDWWFLERGKYRSLPILGKDIIRSKVFPGLWLNRTALLKMDGQKVAQTLNEGLASREHKLFVDLLNRRRK